MKKLKSIDPNLKEQLYKKSQSLSFENFCDEMEYLRPNIGLTHELIRDVCNELYGKHYSEGYYRKGLYKSPFTNIDALDAAEIRYSIKDDIDKVKSSDDRNQIRAYIRKIAREETYKDIALEAVKEISSRKALNPPTYTNFTGENDAILCLSDWHFGIECENAWNTYNEEVAKERISKLRDKVIKNGKKNNVKNLYVLNLGDMIAGRIHLTIRLESRTDVITQIMKVSELLAELLNDLSAHFNIIYYSCLDNHSRLEPNKNDSLDIESLARITDWYLKERLPYIAMPKNKFGEDIITFKCRGYNILGVHGDKDSPNTLIDSISRMTEDHYDLICTSHRHHFSCDEKNRTVIVANSSLMGTDSFAKNLRLSAHPSQNLIIVTDESVCEAIYRIVL